MLVDVQLDTFFSKNERNLQLQLDDLRNHVTGCLSVSMKNRMLSQYLTFRRDVQQLADRPARRHLRL